MKTAICISGYSESLPHVKDNLKEYFDKYIGDYDVYAYVPPSEHATKIKEYFPNATVKIEKDKPIDSKGIKGRFKTGVQRWLQQINGWKESNNMRKESGRDYDIVVRCRPDIDFHSPWFHFKNAKLDRMYVPNFHHYGGINDRFCIAPPHLIDNFMNLIDEAMKQPQNANHAESFLKRVLIEKNTPIELVPIYFARVRKGGEVMQRDRNKFNFQKEMPRYPDKLIKTGTCYE
tara:strand:+ start:8134 stop:8829 length:696 start_codon:yes stop_codon:yes gene_type:complete